MNLRVMTFILFVLCLSLRYTLYAQTEMQPDVTADLPLFHFNAVSFASNRPDTSRLDVYVEVPYEALHFTHADQSFTCQYDIIIDVFDTLNVQVAEKSWTENITAKDYEESVSPRESNLSQRSFILPPRNYLLDVQVRDDETKKTFRQKKHVSVKSFPSTSFSISDVMLVNRLSREGGHTIIYPNISGAVAEVNDSFHIFFEAYDHLAADSIDTKLQVLDERGITLERDSFTVARTSEHVSILRRIPVDKLIAGEYTLQLQVHAAGGKTGPVGSEIIQTSRRFSVQWRGIPTAITDLDLAIDQMQYILPKEKLDEIKHADKDKKQKLFQEYWKRKDPTPNTDRNELMEEYYSRVAYSNKHFTHFIEGWRSDMGMIYIIFGPPNNIERHPFDIDSKPYEIWTYYDINREFVFVDVSGFGDYKLQTPIWDIWSGRPR